MSLPQHNLPAAGKPKLLDRAREILRANYYSRRTEDVYLGWMRRFILFHGKRHPQTMGEAEVAAFLTDLTVRGKIAASTQNQAFSALLFLYSKVLKQPLGDLGEVARATRPRKVPVVLTRQEARALLAQLEGTEWIMASLLYGSGLRVLEMLRLRVKDIDFGYAQITIRDGKGGKDRITMLPIGLVDPLRRHLARRKLEFGRDVEAGSAGVYVPEALARKYPAAASSWVWQYAFAAARPSRDPRSGAMRRHHVDEVTVQRARPKSRLRLSRAPPPRRCAAQRSGPGSPRR